MFIKSFLKILSIKKWLFKINHLNVVGIVHYSIVVGRKNVFRRKVIIQKKMYNFFLETKQNNSQRLSIIIL